MAQALSLGAAPGAMDIGELQPGKQYEVDFYLVTNSENDLVTSLSFLESRKTMFERNATGHYTFIPDEASEEDMKEWLSFLRNVVVVSNKKSFPVKFRDGTTVNANEKVTVVLNVPQDAEPGYHTFEAVLSPDVPVKTGGGAGVAMIGVTRPFFVFKIPGVAERKGTIDGMAGSRMGNRAVVDVLFRNMGTVTVSAKISTLNVYDEMGNYVGTYNGGYIKVPPKSTGIVQVVWPDRDMDKQKTIKVEATVDYVTGQSVKEAMITIPKGGITAKAEMKAEEFPWWIIILIIGLVLLYYYWRRR